MKRILFFHISGRRMTGGDTLIYRLVTKIRNFGYQPILLCQDETPLAEKVRLSGIKTIVVPFPELLDQYDQKLLSGVGRNFIKIIHEIIKWNLQVKQLLGQESISLIWCSNIRGVFTLTPLKVIWRIPLVWNIFLADRFGAWTRVLYAIALMIADRVVTEYKRQSQDAFSKVELLAFRQKIRSVYSGLDLKEFAVVQDLGKKDKIRIGSLCRINPRKGLEVLLDSFALLINRWPNVELHIFGEALSDSDLAYEKRLHAMAENYGINDKVFFNGWCEDPFKAISSLDFFVSAAFHEGLPGAVREALAMGVPVVATDVGGTGELVIDEKTGILVPPGHPLLLATALDRLISNPILAKDLSLAARKRVEKFFSVQSFIRNYSLVFDELILQ